VDGSKLAVRMVDRYALHDEIAAGGMASIRLGRLRGAGDLARTVAVKQLHPFLANDPEFTAMFLDEARLVERIRHPNVVPTLDVLTQQGELFLVMEYVPGEALSQLLKASRRTDPRIVSAILVGVLRGLHAAHEAQDEHGAPLGIVHRDVSPQNILVGADGIARVLDFGVAKAAGRLQATREGRIKGKLSYMAPEQLAGLGVSRRTDVYAAAVVLWEALTCQRLFVGENEGNVLEQVRLGVVHPPSHIVPELTEALDTIVLKGLERSPERRFGTAREMADELARAVPEAPAAEVSAWVVEVAREALAGRSARVSDMERSPFPDESSLTPTTPTAGSQGPGRSRSRIGLAPQVIGRYAIYGKIASGGMASVHLGRQVGGAGFSRTVAIKRLHPHLAEDPEFQSTMIDEARMASRIHHPNVVPTLDVVAAEGELLLVMEYVRGESLSRLARLVATRKHRVPLPIASAIVLGALHGLHAAHEAKSDHGAPLGIVHRDVSPQNILVGVDGMARVIDFGVAKAAGRLQTTQDGAIKGKIAYMAPEQLASGTVTRTADVYAMGVVLWEVLAGTRLFSGDNQTAIVTSVLAGVTEPPSRHAPDLPPGLDALVMRALARDPADRFATALDMAEKLLQLVPPAFQTDVGTWCERTARESLAKRGILLAEVESSSGVGPLASSPDLGKAASSRTVPKRGPDAALPPAALPEGDVDLDGPDLNDNAPTLASQSSILSVETSTPTIQPRSGSRRAMRVGALGAGGLLLTAGLALVVWTGHSAPAAPSAGSATPSVGILPSAVPIIAMPPIPTPAPTATSTSAPPSAPIALSPEPVGTVAPRSAASHPTSRHLAPSAPPRAAPSAASHPRCDPNFTYDANGEKHWKPECFGQ
jgi:serine/threonine protein kinase